MHASIGARALLPAVWIALIGVLTFTVPAMAQDDEAYEGVVVKDRVEVRSGAGMSLYVVGELTKGAKVQVVSTFVNWYQITPPAGVASYISRAYVDAKGDGKTGVVSDESPYVFAASVNGPGESIKPQVRLRKGDVVEIIAQDGSFYKITPPRGAMVFLPPGSVERVTAKATPAPDPTPGPAVKTEPAPAPAPAPKPTLQTMSREQAKTEAPAPAQKPAPAAVAAEPAAAEPVKVTPVATPAVEPAKTEGTRLVLPVSDRVEATTPTPAPFESSAEPDFSTSTPTPAPAPEPVTPSAPQTARATSPSVQAAEQRLAAVGAMPLEKQPLDELMAIYQTLNRDTTLPPTDRRIVSIRIAQIAVAQDRANALKSIKDARVANTTAISMTPAPEPPAPTVYDPSIYNAFGELLASSVYDGETGPRLFRLVDPVSRRTVAYVLPGRYDAARYLGRIVGIIGKTSFDPALRLQVITVERMDVMNSSGNAPALAPVPASAPLPPPAATTVPAATAPAATVSPSASDAASPALLPPIRIETPGESSPAPEAPAPAPAPAASEADDEATMIK